MSGNPEEYVKAGAKVGELVVMVMLRWLGMGLTERRSDPAEAIESPNPEGLLDRNAAAAQLRVSKNTFKAYESKGLIKRVPNMGERTVRFRQRDVDKLKNRLRE